MARISDEQMAVIESIQRDFMAASFFESYRQRREELKSAVDAGDLNAAVERTELKTEMKRLLDYEDPEVLASNILIIRAGLRAIEMNMQALAQMQGLEQNEPVDGDLVQ